MHPRRAAADRRLAFNRRKRLNEKGLNSPFFYFFDVPNALPDELRLEKCKRNNQCPRSTLLLARFFGRAICTWVFAP